MPTGKINFKVKGLIFMPKCENNSENDSVKKLKYLIKMKFIIIYYKWVI